MIFLSARVFPPGYRRAPLTSCLIGLYSSVSTTLPFEIF